MSTSMPGVTEAYAKSNKEEKEEISEIGPVEDEDNLSKDKMDDHSEIINNLKQKIINLELTQSLNELFTKDNLTVKMFEKAILNHELKNWNISADTYDKILTKEILNEENSKLILSFKENASDKVILSDYLSKKEVSHKQTEKDESHEQTEKDENREQTKKEESREQTKKEFKSKMDKTKLKTTFVKKPSYAKDFVNSIAPYAMEIGKKYGVYPSVMIAQASLESAWGGQGKVPDDYVLGIAPNYNLFGIKGTYKGQSVIVKTEEVLSNGDRVSVDAEFKKYPSYKASMEDYASKLRYSKETESWNPYLYRNTWVENATSYIDAIEGLSSWATDPKYKIKLKEIVEDYSLTKYDNIKFDDRDKAADELYKQYRQSNNAVTLWNLAQDFINYYPNDDRAEKVINEAARKHVNYAVTRHNRGDYGYAIGNYNNVINEERVNNSQKIRVKEMVIYAKNTQKLPNPNNLYKKYKASNNAHALWELALDFIYYYPSDSRMDDVINEAANKNMKYALSLQRNDSEKIASKYYEKVMEEPMVSESTRHLAKIFLNQATTNKKRVIYVDSGHGAHDSGAAFNGLKEKHLNLQVSNYLTRELESKGYIVVNSRVADKFIDLTDRAMGANKINADIFVSIHHNSMGGNGTASGIETYIHHRVSSGFGQETNLNKFKLDDPRINESLLLANSIHTNLIDATGMYDRGVKGNNFSVLRNTHIPSILVELGFMDNKKEASIIKTKSYQLNAAKSIANGITTYFQGLK